MVQWCHKVEKEVSKMNLVAGYRKMLGMTQNEMAEKLGISKQSYYKKENKKVSFTDQEKILFKNMLVPLFPSITIDDIFFSKKVS